MGIKQTSPQASSSSKKSTPNTILCYLSVMQWWSLSQKTHICIDFIILEVITFEWDCYLEAYSKKVFLKRFFLLLLFVCFDCGNIEGWEAEWEVKWPETMSQGKEKKKNKLKGSHWTLVNMKKEIKSGYGAKCINLVSRNTLHGRFC